MDIMKLIGQAAKYVALIAEAMAIYEDTIWDPKKKRYAGTEDYSTAVPELRTN